jgi:hypothetical protein
MKTRRRKLAALLGTVIALAAAIAAALAVSGAAATAETEIHACKHPNGGWLRIAGAGGCRAREQAVSWNAAGPAGPKGDTGPAGPAGPKGDPGAGLAKLEDLNGLACTTEDGAAGKVSLDSAGDDTVLIRCTPGGSPPPPPPSGTKLVINEVDYDQVGADADGFVEIKNTGTSPVTLTGIALVLVDGGDSEEYRRHNLTGTIEAGGYVVVATDAQNGAPDGIAIVNTASGALLDALSYEGAITAAKIGTQTYSLVEGTLLPATVADSNTVTGSLIRNPDGKDTNDAASDWVFTKTLTRGAANVFTP